MSTTATRSRRRRLVEVVVAVRDLPDLAGQQVVQRAAGRTGQRADIAIPITHPRSGRRRDMWNTRKISMVCPRTR